MSDDPLCRKLTPSEQQWLPQTSLISLTCQLHPSAAEQRFSSKETLEKRVEESRQRHPFLNVKVNPEELSFERNSEIPVSLVELEADSAEEVRKAVREELEVGSIDRKVALARVVLLRTPSASYLVLIGDHLCFDGKSFMIWLSDLVGGGDTSGKKMHDFVDWTSLIPDKSFSPFSPVFESVQLNALPVADPAELMKAGIDDVVCTIDSETLKKLKQRTKEKGTKLNAPLMMAYFAAMADAYLDQHEGKAELPINVRSVSAADLRDQVGLPSDYMNNSASTVPVHTSISTVEDGRVVGPLWPKAFDAQLVMKSNIAAGEGFRLNDITKRGAFAEFGPYFAILCLWSNMGVCRVPDNSVASVEVHVHGVGNNPIISAHPITVGDHLAVTFSFSNVLHKRSTVEFIAQRFDHHIRYLADNAL
uniref:Condensation domain-containing protein n=1 Tax=Palpitomonas bilix TaxID=652834 RepID=A0A7S3G7W1_9EUKA|mmetsp:Transcript_29110/g.74786  ORF Transcript_29110/g.74786 Transcript_29110/m.74786 type:complete len:420 (+) Transcript_29110:185-1444(+)